MGCWRTGVINFDGEFRATIAGSSKPGMNCRNAIYQGRVFRAMPVGLDAHQIAHGVIKTWPTGASV